MLEIINKEKKILNSKIPIVVKISPDIDDQEINKVSEVLLSNNIEVIIISNSSDSTRYSLIDIQKHQKGGLSGKPIEEKSDCFWYIFSLIEMDRNTTESKIFASRKQCKKNHFEKLSNIKSRLLFTNRF